MSQRDMRWTGQADGCSGIRHAILRRGDSGNHVRWIVHGVAHGALVGIVQRATADGTTWHPAWSTSRAATSHTARSEAVTAAIDPGDTGAGQFDILVTQAKDRQDSAAPIGLDDRIQSGFEAGADQSIDPRQRIALETRDQASR